MEQGLKEQGLDISFLMLHAVPTVGMMLAQRVYFGKQKSYEPYYYLCQFFSRAYFG